MPLTDPKELAIYIESMNGDELNRLIVCHRQMIIDALRSHRRSTVLAGLAEMYDIAVAVQSLEPYRPGL